MKKLSLLLALALLSSRPATAQVVISPNNPASPHASAMLDVQSTDKGMLVPRLTTAQRTAISSPAKGLLVFDTNTNTFWFYNGSAWGPVDGSSFPSTGIVLSETETNIPLTNAGFTAIGKTKLTVEPLNGAPPVGPFAWTGATETDNAPTQMMDFSFVWTGTEMIVWGGQATNAGGRYNPALDKWTPTSLTNAPTPRTFHSAIWTGTEMIIWGGRLAGNTATNQGFRYNPATDTWAAISTSGAPSERALHTAVWTGTEMVIWGGDFGGATGGRYNPTSDTWAPIATANAPIGWSGHSAVWAGTEMLIWGGYPWTNTGRRYNPTTDTWTTITTTNAPSVRGAHTAIWTGSEMVVWAGSGPMPDSYFNDGGRYNPTTDTWTALPTVNAPLARFQHTAVWTGADMIVWGGRPTIYNNFSNFSSGGSYNPNSNTWTPIPLLNAPLGKYGHAVVWTGKAMIVWGGYDASSQYKTGGILTPYLNKAYYLFKKN